jgi:hypothetical protein
MYRNIVNLSINYISNKGTEFNDRNYSEYVCTCICVSTVSIIIVRVHIVLV